ncbi:MAG: alpha/beta hydrolase [Candidatus Aureabacteria bacterium]|nr:alpha/beta hydrolase [Candidatus Auribacterota bacterium]
MSAHSKIHSGQPCYRVRDFSAYIGRHRIFVEGVLPEMETGKTSILFVGGAFDGSWICRQQLDYWAARGWPSYALNLRGYYKSRYRGVSGLGYRDYLDDILSVRNHLHLDNAIYSGYSMGGMLVQKFAEMHGATALILYDSDWPKQVAQAIGEVTGALRTVPPVMHFVPKRQIVEEMMGMAVSDREFRETLAYFRQSFLSGRAYRELEIDRIDVDASKIACPVLVISVSHHDDAQAELARYYNAARLLCEGYSHGSILMSRFHIPVTRSVAEWIARGFPHSVRRSRRLRKPDLESVRRKTMKLFYYSGWNEPRVNICDRRGQELTQARMKKRGPGRWRDESLFEASFSLAEGRKFYLSCQGHEDRPHGRGCYDPSGRTLYLRDGEFFPVCPPHFRQEPVSFTTEIYCRELAHYYKINVMLPRDYSSTERKPYPVAILNDGQNQWKNQGAYGGWHTDAIALDLARRGRCRDLVLVAVFSHPKRDCSYLPPPRGRADLYVRFVADRVLPELRKEINISKDRREVGIIGASFGANCALYAAVKRPDVFGVIGSFSYAHIPDDPVKAKMSSARRLPMARLYLDCGTRWSYDQPSRDDHTGLTRDLVQIARDKKMIPEENLLGVIAEGHYHNELYWRRRIGRCLEFLYPLE